VKFNIPIYHLIFLSSIFCCQGCTVLTYGTYSEPIVPASVAKVVSGPGIESSGRPVGDTIQFRDVTLTVMPRNERMSLHIVGISIIPFLPLPGNKNLSENYASRQKRGPLFVMRVTIDPQADNFTFDPMGVILSLPSGEELNPSAFWWPQSKRASPLVGCSPFLYFDKKTPGPIPTAEAIDPFEIGEETCFTFVFDTAPPSPDEEFSLSVPGIKKRGQDLAIPPIRFQPHSGWWMFR
jgi:hypothetical protein